MKRKRTFSNIWIIPHHRGEKRSDLVCGIEEGHLFFFTFLFFFDRDKHTNIENYVVSEGIEIMFLDQPFITNGAFCSYFSSGFNASKDHQVFYKLVDKKKRYEDTRNFIVIP